MKKLFAVVTTSGIVVRGNTGNNDNAYRYHLYTTREGADAAAGRQAIYDSSSTLVRVAEVEVTVTEVKEVTTIERKELVL
jgi:hypothetical protein